MKVVSRYCDSCGVKIPAQDIEDQVALKYEDSYYCQECKTEVMPLLEGKKGAKSGAAAAKAGGNGAAAKAAADAGAPPARRPDSKSGEKKTASAAAAKPVPTNGARKPGSGTGSSATNRVAKPLTPVSRSGVRKPVADEGAEDGEGDDAPPKRNLLIPAIAGGAIVLAVIVGFVLKSGSGDAPPAVVVEDKAPKAESPKAKSEKSWAAAVAAVKDRGTGDQIKSLNEFIQSGAILDQGVLTRAEAEVETLEDRYKVQGDEAFKELFGKAKGLAEAGSFEEAVAVFQGFPADLRDSPAYRSNVRAEVARFEKSLAAKNEAEPLLRKAEEYAKEKRWRLAVAVLEGYDADEYRDCKLVTERVEKERRKYDELSSQIEQDAASAALEKEQKAAEDKRRAEAAAKRAKEDARVATLKWDTIPTDDLFTWKLPSPTPAKDVWKCVAKDKELTGKSGAGDGAVAWAGAGNKSWQDYIVRFRYKVAKGGFRVGVRSSESACVELQPTVIADGQWHAMEISVRGTDADAYQQIVDGVAKAVKDDGTGSQAGGVSFGLLANSECSFTELQVKVINKAN